MMATDAANSGDRVKDGVAKRPRAFAVRYGRRRPVWVLTLNLTSMIDVVFLLLFFFLATSHFTRPEGTLPADLPTRAAAGPAVEVPRTPIYVRMSVGPAGPQACRLTVDRFHPSPLPAGELAGTLQKIRQEIPGFDGRTPVYLVADERVPWDYVVNAYNAALLAQFEKIYFAGAKP
jgi:biopolymer transport protein ExbD